MFEPRRLQTVFYGGMANNQPTKLWLLVPVLFLLNPLLVVATEAKEPAAESADSAEPVGGAVTETPLPCATNPQVVETSLAKVFKRLRSSQVTSLPGPAGAAIRARNAAEIARSHLDVERFAQEVFRGLWAELDETRQDAWKSTLQSLLQHRYVERVKDPRRHRLQILSTEVNCHIAKSRVALERVGRKAKNTLEFHLSLSSQGWRVYDVVLEGASLVNSWRSRLSRVYREEGHPGLDKQLHRLMRRYEVSQ